MKQNYKRIQGFTLLEVIIGVAIFSILATAMLGTFNVLTRTVKAAREKTVLSALATDYLEIVRNMPYSQVGTLTGNPHGQLPDFTNAVSQKIGAYTYKIYYEVTFLDDPADHLATDAAPNTDPNGADYKQVKMDILNTFTNQVTSFVTNVVPKGLEGSGTGGTLQIQVIDANGNAVQGANIHITYPTTTPSIVLDRATDSTGYWTEVGLPAAVNNYHITISKTGYSSDQTYPITASNPNPVHPDATIAVGQVTKITFSIDLLANLTIKTLDNFCQPLNNVRVNVLGAYLIGTNPNVYAFNQNFSSVSGLISLNNIRWDSYTPTLLSGQSYIVYGTSPIQKIDVLPGTTQTFTMILGTNSTANSMLVMVKDAASGTALEGASVHLQKGGSTPQDYYGTTGGSVWVQNDWSGGGGQVQWSTSTPSQYFQDDGNVDSNSSPTGLRLRKVSGHYPNPGWAESSTFDTGTSATNYTTIAWQPTSQDASAVLQFQLAANNDNATWNYVGPDGTNGSYYTTPGQNISSSLDNNRYVRYKAFLSTSDDKKTPVLTSLNINFVTGCFTPGQVIFTGLTAGNNYNLDVSLPGYQTFSTSFTDIFGNQKYEVLMSP